LIASLEIFRADFLLSRCRYAFHFSYAFALTPLIAAAADAAVFAFDFMPPLFADTRRCLRFSFRHLPRLQHMLLPLLNFLLMPPFFVPPIISPLFFFAITPLYDAAIRYFIALLLISHYFAAY